MISTFKKSVLALALSVGAATAQGALPFDLGGSFTLIDQDGQVRTEKDPNGHFQLLFFGYANCQEICSAALPLIGTVVDDLRLEGHEINPVMITVDPARDTVETLSTSMDIYHDDFIGLTGTDEQLQVAYDAYQIDVEEVFFDPEYGPVYAHGSFIYLLNGDGELLTVLPPILDPTHLAGIVRNYTGKSS